MHGTGYESVIHTRYSVCEDKDEDEAVLLMIASNPLNPENREAFPHIISSFCFLTVRYRNSENLVCTDPDETCSRISIDINLHAKKKENIIFKSLYP